MVDKMQVAEVGGTARRGPATPPFQISMPLRFTPRLHTEHDIKLIFYLPANAIKISARQVDIIVQSIVIPIAFARFVWLKFQSRC